MSTETEQKKADMAAAYARLFLGSEDGKRVLKDLRGKFGVERVVFRKANPSARLCPLEAAKIDGQREVIAEIEAALKTHNPQAWASSLI